MSALTPEQKAEYLRCKGVRCPYCGSEDLDPGPVQIDEDLARQPVECLECQERWCDEFVLTDIRERRVVVATRTRPSDLTREDLEAVVAEIVDDAYLVRDGDSEPYYDRDREIPGADFVDNVCGTLANYGLTPTRGHDDEDWDEDEERERRDS